MRRSQLPLLLALIAFGLTLLSGSYAYNRLLRTVPVLIAAQDVAEGTELTPEMVRVVRVPAGGSTPGALYGPGQVVGKYAVTALFSGEPLTARHLTDRQESKDPLAVLAAEQRVISVPVRPEAVLGGALRAGDVVDVAAAFPPPAEGKQAPVEVLAQGVRVIDLRNASALSTQGSVVGSGGSGGMTANFGSQSDSVPTSVLLLVSSAQAKALVGAAESKATLYLWLVRRDRE